MKRNLITITLVFILFLVSSCKNNETHKEAKIIIGTYSLVDGIRITLSNYEDENCTLFNPMEPKFQRYIQDTQEWVDLRVPYCGCNESCANPPSELVIGYESVFEHNWDYKERWCEGLPSVEVSQKVPSGTYRILVRYQFEGQSIVEDYQTFQVD